MPMQAIVTKATAVYDAVGSIPADKASFATVIQPLIDIDVSLEAATSSVTFVKDVSTDAAVRTAAAAAQSALSAFEVKAGMRLDVFQSLKAAAATLDLPSLAPEVARFVERSLRDFRRRGLDLPEDKRKEIEATKTIISDKCIAYQRDLAEYDLKLYFTLEVRAMPCPLYSTLYLTHTHTIVTDHSMGLGHTCGIEWCLTSGCPPCLLPCRFLHHCSPFAGAERHAPGLYRCPRGSPCRCTRCA